MLLTFLMTDLHCHSSYVSSESRFAVFFWQCLRFPEMSHAQSMNHTRSR